MRSLRNNICGGLAEFELFGDDPFTRNAEPPELTREVRNESDLAAQHHCIAFQRDLRRDLRRGDPAAGGGGPERIVDVGLGRQMTLANLRVVHRVFLVAHDVVEPNAPEVVVAELEGEHAEKWRNADARANANDPAERREAVRSEATERPVNLHARSRLE